MSLITPPQYRFDWTQDQVDDRVNQLPLSEVEFSQLSNLYHRFFGVRTGSAEGELLKFDEHSGKSNRSDVPDRFILNACVRYQYPRIAEGIIADLEGTIGYALTPRYITETVQFDAPTYVYQTEYMGVEKVNVKQVWYPIEGLEAVEVDPYMDLATIVTGQYADMVTPAARIDDRLFTNPDEVYLRDTATGLMFPWFKNDEHQIKRDRPGHYWQLALDTNQKAYTGQIIAVQSKQYVTVEIPVPEGIPETATVYPVYPDSHQRIYEAKPRETFTEDDVVYWRFWFFNYTLVHPDFAAESVDLIRNEVYKLYPEISFKYVIEEAAPPVITVTRASTVTTMVPTITLSSSEDGILHINYDGCSADWTCCCQDWPTSVWVTFSYKTNPLFLPQEMQEYLGRLREAAARRIAAELPTTNCNCPVPYGFIPENQAAYGDSYVAISTGMKVDKVRYGQMHGQFFYAEVLAQAPFKVSVIEAN